MTFEKILRLCEQRGFARRVVDGGGFLMFGPSGTLLRENLKKEWFYNMIVNRDNTVFLSGDSFVDTYEYARDICQKKLPFGVAEVLLNNFNRNKNKVFDFDRHFADESRAILKTTMFVAPTLSKQFFQQWPRQRRMWWRKISASPGRYFLTDIQSDNSVDIKAEFSWGGQLIETIAFSDNEHNELSLEHLQTKDGRRKVQAHFITNTISLPSMVLNILCDAYDQRIFQGTPRPLMRFHRKLAPYKISFAVAASQSALVVELGQLALYLCRQLRADHVSSLLLPSALKDTLEDQWCQYDQLGVPYTVLLNENTLKNGICLLRSRDTTLKEQVHITKLPTYVQQLFKNY